MTKNRITPEHESSSEHEFSSVGSSSGSVKVSFSNKCVRKASTVVPTSDSGLVVPEAGASLCESANSQVSYESSELASATLNVLQVGSENAATSVESTANSEVSSENQSASSSHIVTTDHATRATKTMAKPFDVGEAGRPHAPLKYRKGDTVKYQNGKTAYTVRALLGCGAFGEVYLVTTRPHRLLSFILCSNVVCVCFVLWCRYGVKFNKNSEL